MTKEDVLSAADRTRPNLVDPADKFHWVEVLENQILHHMTMYGEVQASLSEDTLLLDDNYKDMYAYYVVSMIDLANQDIAMYNNSCAFFNEMFLRWQRDWRRTHMPLKNREVT